MDQDKDEHIREAAAVLSHYVDAIGFRRFARLENWEEDRSDSVLKAFERCATVPIINLESSMHHPLQGLGDILTIKEKFGTVDQRNITLAWTYNPKALPMAVPNSLAAAATQYGMNLTIASPPEYSLDPALMAQLEHIAGTNGHDVGVVHDLEKACHGAEIVYAASWASRHFYGIPEQEALCREEYRDWIITEEAMSNSPAACFMHSLPVRRNVVVSDEVLDGPRSVVIEQATNRLHLQKTLLSLIL